MSSLSQLAEDLDVEDKPVDDDEILVPLNEKNGKTRGGGGGGKEDVEGKKEGKMKTRKKYFSF